MRRMHRVVLVAGLVLIAPVLTGCADFDMDKLDVFGLNEKKKLPGERKVLFPQGVPGVTQGIPPEFLKGNQPAADAAQTPPAGQETPAAAPGKKTAAVEPAEEPKPKPKRKPKPATASQPPTRITVQPATQRQQQQPTQDQQPAPQQAQSPSPTAGQSTSTAPWPSAPPPGTFQR